MRVEGVFHERLFEPRCAALDERRHAHGGGLDVVAEDGAGVDEQDAVRADAFARGAHLVFVLRQRAPAVRAPAELDGAVAERAHGAAFLEGFLRRVAEEERGVRLLAVRRVPAEQTPDRLTEFLAEQVPQRHVDAAERVVGLQQIEAVLAHEAADAQHVGGVVQLLAEHGCLHRLAGAVRERADHGGDGGERRGFAFAEAFAAVVAAHAHDERVLAAVADVEHFGHGEIEQVDGFDFHEEGESFFAVRNAARPTATSAMLSSQTGV